MDKKDEAAFWAGVSVMDKQRDMTTNYPYNPKPGQILSKRFTIYLGGIIALIIFTIITLIIHLL